MRKRAFLSVKNINPSSCDRLKAQDLFLHGTNSKYTDVVESRTIMSNQDPETI